MSRREVVFAAVALVSTVVLVRASGVSEWPMASLWAFVAICSVRVGLLTRGARRSRDLKIVAVLNASGTASFAAIHALPDGGPLRRMVGAVGLCCLLAAAVLGYRAARRRAV